MITKENVGIIYEEVNNALAEVGKKYGLIIRTGTLRYDVDGFTAKVTATQESEQEGMPAKSSDFDHLARLFGLNRQYGDSITIKGKPYQICGINPNKPKFSVTLYDPIKRKVTGSTTVTTANIA